MANHMSTGGKGINMNSNHNGSSNNKADNDHDYEDIYLVREEVRNHKPQGKSNLMLLSGNGTQNGGVMASGGGGGGGGSALGNGNGNKVGRSRSRDSGSHSRSASASSNHSTDYVIQYGNVSEIVGGGFDLWK